MSNICLCEIDQDGQCQKCKSTISKTFTDFVLIMREFQERMGALSHGLGVENTCDGCMRKYADGLTAKVVGELGGMFANEEVARSVISGLAKLVQELGATSIPLTQKAWSDLCMKNGWDPK